MHAFTALRLSIWLYWLLLPVEFVVARMLQGRLPEPLDRWLEEESYKVNPVFAFSLLFFAVMCGIAGFVGSIGLLRRRRWGAWVWVGSSLVSFVGVPFVGVQIVPAGADLPGELSSVISGAIIALSFWSDALKHPEKEA